jgi:hypothetical protein
VLRRKFALALTLAVAASLMLAGAALAKDRNHDRIPDRWEKRHHLSLHHKQGKRDQDHDGLKNRAEFKARLDPRDADTDDDGIEDGDENAGTVESFENGLLTVKLASGRSLTAAVNDETEIECDPTAGDDRGHDEGDDDQGDDDHQGDDDRSLADDEPGDDDEGDDAEDCGTEALVAGAKVLEAELEVEHGDAVWEEVELLTP